MASAGPVLTSAGTGAMSRSPTIWPRRLAKRVGSGVLADQWGRTAPHNGVEDASSRPTAGHASVHHPGQADPRAGTVVLVGNKVHLVLRSSYVLQGWVRTCCGRDVPWREVGLGQHLRCRVCQRASTNGKPIRQ